MIKITRIVDKSVLDKVNIDLLKEHLPETDRNIFITYCVTRQPREEDVWEENGITYFRIVLNFEEVLTLSPTEVFNKIKKVTLQKFKEIEL